MLRAIFTVLLLLTVVRAQADVATDSRHYDSYYQIDEPQDFVIADIDLANTLSHALNGLAASAVSLMEWQLNHQSFPEPNQPYDRLGEFGTWLTGGSDDLPACVNTRGRVLIRSSDGPVRMSANGCTVKAGKWHDPYTGDEITDAGQIQIDHVVPLKHAYISGAWTWDNPKRCAYANFMANDFHLLAVSGHENMSKGDSSPDEWMPPNPEFVCSYLKDWLEIKLIWGLIMNPDESQAIKTLFAQNHCDPRMFNLDHASLEKQRSAIVQRLNDCGG